jgi:hypothetical protein
MSYTYQPNSRINKVVADQQRKISALKEEVRKLNILRKKQREQEQEMTI